MDIPTDLPTDPAEAYRRGCADTEARFNAERQAARVSGGHARAAALTPAKRLAIARKAAKASVKSRKDKAAKALSSL